MKNTLETRLGIFFALCWYYLAFRVLWKSAIPLVSLLHAERPTLLGHLIYGTFVGRYPAYLPRPPAPAAAPVTGSTLPLLLAARTSSLGDWTSVCSISRRPQNNVIYCAITRERATGVEPATSSLGSCSTKARKTMSRGHNLSGVG